MNKIFSHVEDDESRGVDSIVENKIFDKLLLKFMYSLYITYEVVYLLILSVVPYLYYSSKEKHK